jgi:F0F1-type ATP synthase assembly protein I
MNFFVSFINKYSVHMIILLLLVCVYTAVLIIKDKIRRKRAIEHDVTKAANMMTYERLASWGKVKFRKALCVVVNMELTAGGMKRFIVTETDGGFIYRKKRYLFDNEAKYYDYSARMFSFDYHEELSLPIRRNLNIHEIKHKLETEKNVEVEYVINPATLDRFVTSKIAEGVMKGAAIDGFLRQMRMLLIITLIVCVIHAVLFMQKTGMFANIKLPF